MARMTIRSLMALSTQLHGVVEVTLTGYVDTNELGALERAVLNPVDPTEDGSMPRRPPEQVRVRIERE